MRPTKPCARCVRDLSAGCEHLANTYDKAMLKGLNEQDLIEYALNRMLALDRDNGNKAEGQPASRIYKSRNVAVSDTLSKKCHVRQGALGCLRNAGHEGPHKF